MVAISLSMVLIEIAAMTSTQVQESVRTLRFRSDVVAPIGPTFFQLEQDLKHLVAFNVPPSPFLKGLVPIAFDSPTIAPLPGDPPAPFVRKADVLTLVTTTPQGWREVVEYCLEQGEGMGVGGPLYSPWTPGTSTWTAPAGGGLQTSRLLRRVVYAAAPGGALAADTKYPLPTTLQIAGVGGQSLGTVVSPQVLLDNVLSFQLSYIPATGTEYQNVVAAPKPGVPNPQVLFQGQLGIAGLTAVAIGGPGSPDSKFLASLPVGTPIELAVNADAGGTTSSWAQPTTIAYARRASGAPPATTVNDVTQVELTERVVVSPAIPWHGFTVVNPYQNGGHTQIYPPGRPPKTAAPVQTVNARAFAPPRAVGVTLVVRYGSGPDAPLATFHTQVELPHP
jgi:hypothetical protein